jgi:trigger factor
MPSISRENLGYLHEQITITIFEADFKPALDNSLKKHAQKANIPGFRKGLVPMGILKNMYGKSIIVEELSKITNSALKNFLETEKIQLLTHPIPVPTSNTFYDDLNVKEYSFCFELALQPNITIDYSKLSVPKYKIEVTEAMILEEIDRLMYRFGKMTDPETVDNIDCFLNVTFIEADANEVKIEGGIEKENSILVKYFTADYQTNLMGKKVGESVFIKLENAFEEKQNSAIIADLGLNTVDDNSKFFIVEITKIGYVEKAELNSEFYGLYSPIETIESEDELKEVVKNDMEKACDFTTTSKMNDEIYLQLMSKIDVELPEEFLKNVVRNGENGKSLSDVDIEKELVNSSNSLKWFLIRNEIVQQNNIKVDIKEMRLFAKSQLLQYMGGSSLDMLGENESWLNDYVDKMMKDKKFTKEAFDKIIGDKVFEVVAQNIEKIETPISIEEFVKFQQN